MPRRKPRLTAERLARGTLAASDNRVWLWDEHDAEGTQRRRLIGSRETQPPPVRLREALWLRCPLSWRKAPFSPPKAHGCPGRVPNQGPAEPPPAPPERGALPHNPTFCNKHVSTSICNICSFDQLLQRSVIVVNRGSDRYILLVKKKQCAL